MKTVAIIQARMGSTRLPGKVMKQLCGRSVLAHVIFRVRACPLVDDVVVATTTSPRDDIIVVEAQKCGTNWFRGSESDVLERYYIAAKSYQAGLIVRVTSDCPLFDPNVLSQMLEHLRDKSSQGDKIDYLSNTLQRTYPRGLDAEVIAFDALEHAFLKACQSYQREHVTPFIYEHSEWFVLRSQTDHIDLSSYRWTLDTPEDWEFISEIYNNLYHEDELFSTAQILDFLQERPELLELNTHVNQKKLWG